MKKIAFFSFFAICVITGFSQRNYYIYLQTDNNEPFFVKMNNRLFSSAPSGYLILSQLKDSTHYFSIGFPKQDNPQQFYITMNHKDHGFLVKNFGEKGWGLFDLETLGIQMASKVPLEQNGLVIKTEKKESSAFTDLLSKAVNDTTLNQKLVIEENKDPKPVTPSPVVKAADTLMKKEEKEQVVKNDLLTANKDITRDKPGKDTIAKTVDAVKEIVTTNAPAQINPVIKEKSLENGTGSKTEYTRSLITKRSEAVTSGGASMVFIDEMDDGKKDTVRILIPAEKKEEINKPSGKENSDLKFLNIFPDENKKDSAKDTAGKRENEVKVTACSLVADENDFFNLRKEMAGETSDDRMIVKAGESFSQRCYTTEQVKNLGNLFLTDGGKLKFYQAAWQAGHIADKKNFPLLESELKTEEYKGQFRQLIAIF